MIKVQDFIVIITFYTLSAKTGCPVIGSLELDGTQQCYHPGARLDMNRKNITDYAASYLWGKNE